MAATLADRSIPRGPGGPGLAPRWFAAFVLVYGAWVVLPWLAPVLMRLDLAGPGRAIYLLYSLFCHQLPERSFFLFGPQGMYSLTEVRFAWQDTLNPMVLRQFIGSAALGWKVAWSDRMVSFYSSVLLFGLAWWPLRRRVRPAPWWISVLLLAPIAVDGISHAVSDVAGLGLGFRDSNAWLTAVVGDKLPVVYAGDALGSFNSWARLVTGVLAGLGIAWFVFPRLEGPVGGA